MSTRDLRGCEISGATPAALEAFERALALFQSWRSGADREVAIALQEAPSFVMAHVLDAYLSLGGRDPVRVRGARPALARAAYLPCNPRERRHVAAIAAVLGDDYETAKTILGDLLREHPLDVLALQVAHAMDYATGDVAHIAGRVSGVMPAWTDSLPGYHAVIAMHAFGLEECGDYGRAENLAHRAIELQPDDARAYHVVAHVFEMTARAEAGIRWMRERAPHWAEHTVAARHCWWHLALFHVAQAEIDRALALYDRNVRPDGSTDVADMIDATALLWRIELAGGDSGERWRELASAWTPHIQDGFCTFTDLHAMLAFVGARDFQLAARLEAELVWHQRERTRHAETTRLIGLPVCRALIAFGRGDYLSAIELLAALPAIAHRMGGSHAQRDVLNLTLLKAVESVRRPRFRQRIAA
jgi:tetratricopeptide (TPR) repeat protein